MGKQQNDRDAAMIEMQKQFITSTSFKSKNELAWEFTGSTVMPSGERTSDGKYLVAGSVLWYRCYVNAKLCLKQVIRMKRNPTALTTYFIAGEPVMIHSKDELINRCAKPHLY